jgi:hypothetical protein
VYSRYQAKHVMSSPLGERMGRSASQASPLGKAAAGRGRVLALLPQLTGPVTISSTTVQQPSRHPMAPADLGRLRARACDRPSCR